MKILCLILLTIVAIVVDWIVIHRHWAFKGYHYVGWTVVYGLCFYILREFVPALGITIAISIAEDIGFLLYAASLKQRPWWPLYCHEWMVTAYGKWVKPLSYNWFGVPSYYYIGIVASVLMITLG